jgi:hypothetical protein
MQIKALVFYHSSGERRILKFELGSVNIITGESKTGKTALIDIIDYCLGSKECKISEGVIRDKVEWFAILLSVRNDEIFVARQNPNRLGQVSTQNIYLSVGDEVRIPDRQELINNSNIGALRDLLTKKLFVAEYTSVPETPTREPLTVTFKHCRLYSFQPQYLIAQRDFLFYNQAEDFVEQSMRDTLPYLLGAVREDTVRIEQLIALRRRELNRVEREIREFERLKQDGTRKLFELVDEAKQLDLLPVEVNIENSQQAIEILNSVATWQPESSLEVQGENRNLKRLLDEKAELLKSLGRSDDDIAAVQTFIGQTFDYSTEAQQQKLRLETINLFSRNGFNSHSCPLCNQEINSEIPSISAINNSLETLSQNLTSTIAERPKLAKYLEGLGIERDNLRKEIEIRDNSIRAIYLEQEDAQRLRDASLRRGKIIGRISSFLESFAATEEDSELRTRAKTLLAEIEELSQLISSDEKESRLSSVLNQINIQMTSWSSLLDLEHQDSPIRFDLKRMTIFADTPQRSIPLPQMGSGANWVAYHLLIHFALHKHFVRAERPVPRFLVLDQPSQIYYPPEKDPELKGVLQESSDEAAVRQMYEFIFSVTNELAPNFQVIVTDHAKLNSEAFRNATIEEWRNGVKLIPIEWQ